MSGPKQRRIEASGREVIAKQQLESVLLTSTRGIARSLNDIVSREVLEKILEYAVLHDPKLSTFNRISTATRNAANRKRLNNATSRVRNRLVRRGKNIGDRHMRAFSKAIEEGRFSKILFLDLRGNNIGDAGMIAFSDAVKEKKMPNLSILTLENNPFGDIGLNAFVEAISVKGTLPRLTTLNILRNTNVTNTGMNSLVKALSNPDVLPKLSTLYVAPGMEGNLRRENLMKIVKFSSKADKLP